MFAEESVQKLLLRWRDLCAQGQEPSVDELCRDHPELKEAVQQRIEALHSMEGWLALHSLGYQAPQRPSQDIAPVQRPSSTATSSAPTSGGSEGNIPEDSRASGHSSQPQHPPAHWSAPTDGAGQPPSSGSSNTPPDEGGNGWPSIPDYQILGELGKGGMGIVYRARHLPLDRVVALKMLHKYGSTDADTWRFTSETRAMARLDHPHIVPIYHVGTHEGQPFFSMKLLNGGPLTQHLPRLAREPHRAVTVLIKVTEAVAYLHDQKILHRDLKSANILLDEDDEPYVSDFGLAKLLDAGIELTLPGVVMGTLPYMAPEQLSGQNNLLCPQTEVWSLGVILHEVLTGTRPFPARDRTELAHQIRTETPVPARHIQPDLDESLEKVILRCLHKEPASRYGSARDLAEDLTRWLQGKSLCSHNPPILPQPAVPDSAREHSLPQPPAKTWKKWTALVACLLCLLGSSLGLGFWWYEANFTPSSSPPPIPTPPEFQPDALPPPNQWQSLLSRAPDPLLVPTKDFLSGWTPEKKEFWWNTRKTAFFRLGTALGPNYEVEVTFREASPGASRGIFVSYQPEPNHQELNHHQCMTFTVTRDAFSRDPSDYLVGATRKELNLRAAKILESEVLSPVITLKRQNNSHVTLTVRVEAGKLRWMTVDHEEVKGLKLKIPKGGDQPLVGAFGVCARLGTFRLTRARWRTNLKEQ